MGYSSRKNTNRFEFLSLQYFCLHLLALRDVRSDLHPNYAAIYPSDGPVAAFVPPAVNRILKLPDIGIEKLSVGTDQFAVRAEAAWPRLSFLKGLPALLALDTPEYLTGIFVNQQDFVCCHICDIENGIDTVNNGLKAAERCAKFFLYPLPLSDVPYDMHHLDDFIIFIDLGKCLYLKEFV